MMNFNGRKKQTRSIVAAGLPIVDEHCCSTHVPTRMQRLIYAIRPSELHWRNHLFSNAHHTSARLLSCLIFVMISGCDALTQFDFELNESFEIPGRSSAALPADEQGYGQVQPPGFADLELTQNTDYAEQGVPIEHVESLTLLGMTLTAQPESVRDPYAYLDALRFVAVVGGEEIELAVAEGEPLRTSGRVLELAGTDANLKAMLESTVTIALRIKGNQPLGNRSFQVDARFRVDLF